MIITDKTGRSYYFEGIKKYQIINLLWSGERDFPDIRSIDYKVIQPG